MNYKKAYKRLNKSQYKSIINDTLIPLFDDLDNEFTTMLTPETVFEIKKSYYEGKKMGFNIYADGVLVETKGTKKKARKYLEKLNKGGKL